MASVSVYRSYAKCVLDIKTLILPTQDNGWLSVPPNELCNYQQQPGADTGGVDRVDIHPPFFSKKKFEMSLYLK